MHVSSNHMDFTLSIRIPFLLLGRRAIWNPDLTVPTQPLSPPSAPSPNSPQATSPCKQPKNHESYTFPLQLIHKALETLYPDLTLKTLSHPPFISTQRRIRGWLLCPVPTHHLSRSEQSWVDPKTWVCTLALYRCGLPTDPYAAEFQIFINEMRRIFFALRTFAENEAPLDDSLTTGEVRWWDVLCAGPEVEDGGSITIMPSPAVDIAGFHYDEVRRTYIATTALERVLTSLGTPRALIKFHGIGRFLEYMGIKNMGTKRKELWERAREMGATRGERGRDIPELEMEEYIRKKEEEDKAFEKLRGRRREWWDILTELDDSGLENLVQSMKHFQQTGRKMSVECVFESQDTASPSQATERVVGLRFQGILHSLAPQDLIATTELIASLMCFSTAPSLSTYLAKLANPSPLHPTDLCTKILDILALSKSSRSFLLSYLDTVYTPLTPAHSNILTPTQPDPVRPPSTTISTATTTSTTTTSTIRTKHISTPTVADANALPDSRKDPFAGLRKHKSATLQKERAYMPIFVQRFEAAGGFYPTGARKLAELLRAEEMEKKKKRTRRKGVRDGITEREWKRWRGKKGLEGVDDSNDDDGYHNGIGDGGMRRRSRLMEWLGGVWVEESEGVGEE